jgi:AraC-like DNA-binding protein
VRAALTPYVASILSYREWLGDTEVNERVVPDGSVRLAINFGDAPTTADGDGERVEAIGASTRPALVRLRGKMDGITVTLRAGAAFALLGVPARELTETAVPLEVLWGEDALCLRESLLEAPSHRARVSLLERALLARLARRPASDSACATRAAELIARTDGRLSVRELADSVGVGERRLQQLFQQHVGLSPRAYGRLARLQALLRALRVPEARTEQGALRPAPSPSWARLAVDTGYYDQAHLANEFRAFCGVSPGAFLPRVSGSSKTVG